MEKKDNITQPYLECHLKPLSSDYSVRLYLFQNVHNPKTFGMLVSSAVRKDPIICSTVPNTHLLWRPDLFCVTINPKQIVSLNHVTYAVARAVSSEHDGRKKTKSVETEVLYWLSPYKNISTSLETYSANNDCCEVLMAVAFKNGLEKTFERIDEIIELVRSHNGELVPVSYLSKISDKAAIKKQLRLSAAEERLSGGLESAMLSRIAVKGL